MEKLNQKNRSCRNRKQTLSEWILGVIVREATPTFIFDSWTRVLTTGETGPHIGNWLKAYVTSRKLEPWPSGYSTKLYCNWVFHRPFHFLPGHLLLGDGIYDEAVNSIVYTPHYIFFLPTNWVRLSEAMLCGILCMWIRHYTNLMMKSFVKHRFYDGQHIWTEKNPPNDNVLKSKLDMPLVLPPF